MAMDWNDIKGETAARLRQRKYALLRRFQIPPDALPGSLVETHHRCGKPNCRCAQGELHPMWSLTFMVEGKKHVQHIPRELVEELQPLVEQGREFKDAVAEVFAANAQLLGLWRQQLSKQNKNKNKKRSKPQ
jgi:hypothetical protein